MVRKIRDVNGNVYVRKKPFYKRVWFIVLVVLVLASGVTNLGKKSSTTSTVSSSTAISSSESSETSVSTTEADSSDSSSSDFNPQDVSDATIESIKTYNDYLTMYEFIVKDYVTNYENAIQQYGIDDPTTYQEIRQEVEDSVAEQKKEYGLLGHAPLMGKEGLVQFLKDYRDELKTYTDQMAAGI